MNQLDNEKLNNKNNNLDNIINNDIDINELELTNLSHSIMEYIKKQAHNKDDLYKLLLEVQDDKILIDEMGEEQWVFVLYNVWLKTYKKAIEDDYISPAERNQLMKIYGLMEKYRNVPTCSVIINKKLITDMKDAYNIDIIDEDNLKRNIKELQEQEKTEEVKKEDYAKRNRKKYAPTPYDR